MSVVVYQNFDTHPERKDHAREVYRRQNLRMVDAADAFDPCLVSWVLTKTRYVDDAVAERFPNLRGIVVLGPEAWMVDINPGRGLAIRTIDENRGYEVAEHAIMLCLATLKRLGRTRRYRSLSALLRHALWAPAATETRGAHNWADAQTATLYRKNVGIVGYGLIGREIHRRLQGFDVCVHYYHRTRYPERIETSLGLRFRPLDELFATCDAVFVQLPLTSTTRGLVSRIVLQQANPQLVIINCGRAAVIDEDALYENLRDRRIAGYAADVFWREPMSFFDRFRRLSNCLITPHMAESLLGRKHDLLERALTKIF